jgi:hypothetical protein
MNKQVSIGKLFSKESLSSIKLPKSITITHIILIVVAITLLALTIYFAISYFSAVSNKVNLNHTVTQKQQEVNAFGALQNIGALQSQLEDGQQDLIDKSPFPLEIHNTDAAYSILQAAREANIACFSYSPGGAGGFDINGNAYIKNNYTISAQGAASTGGEKLNRIINFLVELEGAYDTSMISGTSLSRSSGSDLWTVSFTYSILSLQLAQ